MTRADADIGPDWLDAIYRAHGREIFGFCHRLLADRSLAEEVTQDAFVKAWRARARFDGSRASVRTWLFQIARNAAIDAHRARSVRPKAAAEEVPEAPAADTVDGLADRWVLEQVLDRLPVAQRDAVVEVHVRGRTYAEVADAMGVPTGTVKSRVFNGLVALRDAIERGDLLEEES